VGLSHEGAESPGFSLGYETIENATMNSMQGHQQLQVAQNQKACVTHSHGHLNL
jgi:hypothetical protein